MRASPLRHATLLTLRRSRCAPVYVLPPSAAVAAQPAEGALHLNALLARHLYLAHAAGALRYERLPADAPQPPLLELLDGPPHGRCIVLRRPSSRLLHQERDALPDLQGVPLFSVQRPAALLDATAPRSRAYVAITPHAYAGWPRAASSGACAQLHLARAIALATCCADAADAAARLGDERSWFQHALAVRGFRLLDADAPLPWSARQLKYRKDRLVRCARCSLAAALPPSA